MSRFALLLLTTTLACARTPEVSREGAQGHGDRVASITGLSGPEAVRYDHDQDVLFISNFNGEAAGDSNGFITRARSDGTIDSLRFMVGTAAAPLHGPRGMFIVADTLFVADADGVHAFDRRTGAQVRFVDFRSFEPGFINDVVQGPDGALYITDTGRSRVYRLAGTEASVAIEDAKLLNPNGIAWDAAGGRFLLASWDPGVSVHAWDGAAQVMPLGARGSRNDGIELIGDRVVFATQADSTIRALQDGTVSVLIVTAGAPADIGVDTRRSLVAVPFVNLNRVDLWSLPIR